MQVPHEYQLLAEEANLLKYKVFQSNPNLIKEIEFA